VKVLFVASECAPFVKTGGLADVIGAVPKALSEHGVEPRIMMPLYPALEAVATAGKAVWQAKDLQGGAARLIAVNAQGLELLLLDCPHLFKRAGGIYLDPKGADWSDNALRFGALSQAAAEVAVQGVAGWTPDVVHVHDWQAGLVPAYLRQAGPLAPPSVLTIHNIAFQGNFSPDLMQPLGLDKALFTQDGLEFWGHLGFLKAGMVYTDKITTVSPTYAREIMQPEFGMGFEGLLSARAADLSGILNGIDLDVWNPETDTDLVQNYSAKSLSRKKVNRAAVLDRFGLATPDHAPLFCVISRLTTQKGMDVLLDALPAIVARGAGLALLGSGDRAFEEGFTAAADQFKGQVGAIIGYDEGLSHLMQGGSDAILIPSRFEPCGLTQLYGLRYGTIPVVARTGGLADTVIDANEAAIATNCSNGLQFAPITAQALTHAIHRTCDLFALPRLWSGMMRRAMRHPVGWGPSAEAYLDVYKSLKDT
jgi:starch synthase